MRSMPRHVFFPLCITFLTIALPRFAGAVIHLGGGAAALETPGAAALRPTPRGALFPMQPASPDCMGGGRTGAALQYKVPAANGGARIAVPDTVAADDEGATSSAADEGAQAVIQDTVAVETVIPALPDTVEGMQRIWTIDELDSVLVTAAEGATTEGTSWQRRKNSRVAMLCALLFPGLGQIYNEKPYKAAIVLAAETFYLSNILLNYRYAAREMESRDRFAIDTSEWQEHDAWMAEYKERMTDWIWWSAGALLVIVLDAYVDAHLHDMDFELESTALGDGTGVAVVLNF
jgi:hypothetical protein